MSTVSAPPRIKLQNILFATDFSRLAPVLLAHSLDVARRYGAALYTINVLPHTPFVESVQPDPQQFKFLADREMSNLMRSASLHGVEHKELIEEGEVPEVIARLVRTHAIDLIIMGTSGRHVLGKLLLGSVAEEVFRNAECPVLTMGPHATRWGVDGNLQHVLFATDFGIESMNALPYALSLAEENQAKLTLLHVSPQLPVEFGLHDHQDVMKYTKTKLEALIPKGTQLWQEPRFLVEFGQPVEMILRATAQTADMIVLGVKRPTPLTKHLGEGVAYQIACEAPCPVLSVGARYHG